VRAYDTSNTYFLGQQFLRKAFITAAATLTTSNYNNVITPDKNFNRASTTFSFTSSIALVSGQLVLITVDNAFSKYCIWSGVRKFLFETFLFNNFI